MFRNETKASCEISEQTVKLDIIKRGWQVIDAPPECPFDLLVDMGLDENGFRKIETIQVKSLTSPTWTKSRSGSESDIVSKSGKIRNTHSYYDEGINWLAVPITGAVSYWPRHVYEYKSPSQLKKITPSEFPNNNGVILPLKEKDRDLFSM